MKQTNDERRAYSRGYQRGLQGRWPENVPPHPPEPVVAQLMAALKSLRDSVDNYCAQLTPDDEWAVDLGPQVDRADEALTAVTKWLWSSSQHPVVQEEKT